MTENKGVKNDGIADRDEILTKINQARTSGFHLKTWLLAGMGFFTDAYDLFIIGVVLGLLPLAGWAKLTTAQNSLIASTALIAAVVGALVFGRLLDRFGRKAVYGLELVLLVFGALGSAFLTPVNGVAILIAWRFLLGIGIGGDYATSSTIMAEYSNTKKRGMLVGMVFSMQSLGLLAGPIITLGLLLGGVSPVIAWKVLLALGAVPAAAVIYYRRKMPETPKYTVGVKGNAQKAARDLKNYAGIGGVSASTASDSNVPVVKTKWYYLFTDFRLLALVIGTAGSWFLMDWALYGNSIMSSSMLGFLVPSSVTGIHHLIMTTELSALIFGVAAFPGYWIATFTLDRIGRKPIQMIGFAAMTVSFGLLAFVPGLISVAQIVPFLALYGISYFFIEFGPNVTTFVYPPEVFPVSTRGLGSGMAAAGGKTGAFLGTLLNLGIVAAFGENGLFLLLAFFSAVGLVLTFALLPEPKQRILEDISGESRYLVSNSKIDD